MQRKRFTIPTRPYVAPGFMCGNNVGKQAMSYPTKFNYVTAKSKKFSLVAVRVIIDRHLAHPDNNLYPRVERLLGEPGSTGRVSWDQCMAVQLLLDVDADEDSGGAGELTAMVSGGQLTMPALGNELMKTLRAANLIIERGRIVGVVEADDAA